MTFVSLSDFWRRLIRHETRVLIRKAIGSSVSYSPTMLYHASKSCGCFCCLVVSHVSYRSSSLKRACFCARLIIHSSALTENNYLLHERKTGCNGTQSIRTGMSGSLSANRRWKCWRYAVYFHGSQTVVQTPAVLQVVLKSFWHKISSDYKTSCDVKIQSRD